MNSYIERTPNKTLLLTATLDFGNGPVEDCVVIQVEDRFNQIITPDPKATEDAQQRIDDRLKHYSTKRKLDGLAACEHGLPKSVCTLCFQDDKDRYGYA